MHASIRDRTILQLVQDRAGVPAFDQGGSPEFGLIAGLKGSPGAQREQLTKRLLATNPNRDEFLFSNASIPIAIAIAETTPERIRARLTGQVETLLQDRAGLPEERLAQEIALLVTKADIREELDRLEAHCQGARELLASNEPVGRKLDFLTQEFNRESNTLCSKASDVALTRIGLELKSVVEQLREQVQNIE